MKLAYSTFFFILLASAKPDIHINVNQDSIHVGDKTTLTIATNNSVIRLLEFPDIDIDNEDLTLTTIEKNGNSLKLSIQFWKDGIHNFPSIKINAIYNNGSTVEFITDKIEFTIFSRAVVNGGDLRDNKINMDVQLPITLLQCILFIIIAITLLIIYNIIRNRGLITFEKVSPNVDALTEALKKLEDIIIPEKLIVTELEVFYMKLSKILKLFLMNKYFFNATNMTTSEIIIYLNNNNLYNATLEEIFIEADLCKFAQRKVGVTQLITTKNTVRRVLEELDMN